MCFPGGAARIGEQRQNRGKSESEQNRRGKHCESAGQGLRQKKRRKVLAEGAQQEKQEVGNCAVEPKRKESCCTNRQLRAGKYADRRVAFLSKPFFENALPTAMPRRNVASMVVNA
jgi:hypothetical protein